MLLLLGGCDGNVPLAIVYVPHERQSLLRQAVAHTGTVSLEGFLSQATPEERMALLEDRQEASGRGGT